MTPIFSWLRFFDQTLFFRILFSSASRAHFVTRGLWWTEGSCSGESIITRVAN